MNLGVPSKHRSPSGDTLVVSRRSRTRVDASGARGALVVLGLLLATLLSTSVLAPVASAATKRAVASSSGIVTISGLTPGHEYEVTATDLTPEPAPAPEGEVKWYGDLSSGTIDPAIYPYSNFVSGHVKVVPDPLGSGHKVLQYAIDDKDRPYSGATNPRGDVESPTLFGPGADFYVSMPHLVPSGFPAVNKGWWQVDELYGKPYGGSPPIGIYIWNINGANHYLLQRQGGTVYWTSPAIDAKWHTVTLHVHFATDSTASVDVYYDGAHAAGPFNYGNLVANVNWEGKTPNFLNINSYRQAGAYPGTISLYHGAPTVATTLAASLSKQGP
jgi:hypothetical protein